MVSDLVAPGAICDRKRSTLTGVGSQLQVSPEPKPLSLNLCRRGCIPTHLPLYFQSSTGRLPDVSRNWLPVVSVFLPATDFLGLPRRQRERRMTPARDSSSLRQYRPTSSQM